MKLQATTSSSRSEGFRLYSWLFSDCTAGSNRLEKFKKLKKGIVFSIKYRCPDSYKVKKVKKIKKVKKVKVATAQIPARPSQAYPDRATQTGLPREAHRASFKLRSPEVLREAL